MFTHTKGRKKNAQWISGAVTGPASPLSGQPRLGAKMFHTSERRKLRKSLLSITGAAGVKIQKENADAKKRKGSAGTAMLYML